MIWLLTIRGAAEWRITSSNASVSVVESATGQTRVFWPGLEDPQPTESVGGSDGMEVPISTILPTDAWESLSGSDPAGWTAELAWIMEGDDWRSRTVILDGRVDRPVYETVTDAVEFSIIENPWDDRSLYPLPGQQVGAATWPVNGSLALPENVDGIWYPWVFGCPGFIYSSDVFSQMFGWPVVLVEIDGATRNNYDVGALDATVLIAGHPCGFSSVVIYNRSTGLSATIATATARDLLGSVVTTATVVGGDLKINDGDELWASAANISESGITSSTTRALRGMGGIVRWLVENSTIRFDQSKIAMLARLDRFKADFYVNEPTSAWGIIQDNVIGADIVPAFWRRSRWGYFLAVQPFDTVVPSLQISDEFGWERDGGMTCSSGQDVMTDLVLLYAEDQAQGASLRSLVYAPLAATGATLNPYCASAYAAIKVRRKLETSAPGVQDPGTARLILDLLARRRSTTIRTGSLVCQRADTRAEVGLVVAVTNAGINLTSRLCWITSVQISTTETRIEVETLPDLQRTGPV